MINMAIEQWLAVVGYEGLYEVSNLGRIRTLDPRWLRRIKKAPIGGYGYPWVSLSKNGIKWQPAVHTIVAMAFIPNPNNLPEVNHKNGVKTDARVDNLEWVTKSQNKRHSVEVLGKGCGETHRWARLTEENVRLIRKMIMDGYSNREIVAMFPLLTMENVLQIKHKRSWRHLQ